jgi:hypothetical protein
MIATIIAWLSQSWFGQIVGLAISWYTNWQAQKTAAANAETSAELAHQDDGAQSVDDRNSTDSQNSALDQIEKQIDNPTPIIVVKGDKP